MGMEMGMGMGMGYVGMLPKDVKIFLQLYL